MAPKVTGVMYRKRSPNSAPLMTKGRIKAPMTEPSTPETMPSKIASIEECREHLTVTHAPG